MLAAAALCAAAAGAPAQSDKPGPMQSGQHATPPAEASAATAGAAASDAGAFDVKQLFANVCGWCHSSGGREAGKGPKLMNTALTDSEIAYRIKTGKTGQMPAFGASLSLPKIQSLSGYVQRLGRGQAMR